MKLDQINSTPSRIFFETIVFGWRNSIIAVNGHQKADLENTKLSKDLKDLFFVLIVFIAAVNMLFFILSSKR